MEIKTARLLLTQWAQGDAEAFHQIWGDPEVISWGPSESVAASALLLARVSTRCASAPPPCGWFAIKTHEGEVAGNVMLQPTEKLPDALEIGWHLKGTHQGLGYATEAADALLTCALERLDVSRVIALIMPSNAPSRRVAQRLEMTLSGRIEHAGRDHEVWAIEGRSQAG